MTENLKKKALQHKVTPAKSENLKKKKDMQSLMTSLIKANKNDYAFDAY